MAAGNASDGFSDFGKLILRLIVGLGIMTHGYPKVFGHTAEHVSNMVGFTAGVAKIGFPYPQYFAWAAALAEFAGGTLLAAGLFTRLSAFFIACTMAVAVYVNRAEAFKGMELALLYFGPALFLLLSGPGRFSLDALFFRRK